MDTEEAKRHLKTHRALPIGLTAEIIGLADKTLRTEIKKQEERDASDDKVVGRAHDKIPTISIGRKKLIPTSWTAKVLGLDLAPASMSKRQFTEQEAAMK